MKTKVKVGEVYWRKEQSRWDSYRGYIGVTVSGEFALSLQSPMGSRGKSGPSTFPPPGVLRNLRGRLTSIMGRISLPKGALTYTRQKGEESRWDVFLTYPGIIPPELIVYYPDAPGMASVAMFHALKWPEKK